MREYKTFYSDDGYFHKGRLPLEPEITAARKTKGEVVMNSWQEQHVVVSCPPEIINNSFKNHHSKEKMQGWKTAGKGGPHFRRVLGPPHSLCTQAILSNSVVVV